MSVVIRMKRTGRRNRPCYRISVADSRSPRDGRTLETLGLYDPLCKNTDQQTTLNVDRARHWLSNGAQPSDTVRSILKRMGVFEDFSIEKKRRRRPGRKTETKTGLTRSAAQAERAARKEARRNERIAALRAQKAAAKAEEEPSEEEAPAEDAPVEDAPVEDAPVEESPAEEAPAEEAPAEEAPADEESEEDAPDEGAPADEESAEDAPADTESKEE